MPLTRDFRETIAEEARKSAEFRRALLAEAAESFLGGELDTAKAILRDMIEATIGYRALRDATGIPEKSLIQMFGPSGNPRAGHLARVLEALQQHEDVRLEVRARRKHAA